MATPDPSKFVPCEACLTAMDCAELGGCLGRNVHLHQPHDYWPLSFPVTAGYGSPYDAYNAYGTYMNKMRMQALQNQVLQLAPYTTGNYLCSAQPAEDHAEMDRIREESRLGRRMLRTAGRVGMWLLSAIGTKEEPSASGDPAQPVQSGGPADGSVPGGGVPKGSSPGVPGR